MNKSNKILEFIGWYGLVAILLGYALISFSIIPSRSYIYHGLMLTGSIGIVLVSYQKKNYQPMVLNILFASIALISFILLAIK